MRKIFQRQQQIPFLPNISQPSSKRYYPLSSSKNTKENALAQGGLVQKIKMEPAHHCLAKRNSFRTTSTPPSPIESLISKKLLEKDQVEMDIPTQPRGNKPWVAQEFDLNILATKTSRLGPLQTKNGSTKILRRKSCHYNTPSSEENTSKEIQPDKTTKIPRTIGSRALSLPRDKLNSCKIAMKKGTFPMDQKKFQRQKMAQFFDDDCLSTINDKQSEGPGLFMSFDSYLQIDF